MQKIGLLLDNFGPSDVAFSAITAGNNLDKDIDVCGFFIDLHPPCINPNFAFMEAGHSQGFGGPVIATSQRTAEYLRTNTAPYPKYYYIWDLEWVNKADLDFEHFRKLLLDLKIVARNNYIADLLRRVWNIEPVAVIDDFNLSEFTHV